MSTLQPTPTGRERRTLSRWRCPACKKPWRWDSLGWLTSGRRVVGIALVRRGSIVHRCAGGA